MMVFRGTAVSSTSSPVTPALTGVAGLSAGDGVLFWSAIKGNLTASVALADGGGAIVPLVNTYYTIGDMTIVIAYWRYAGNGNPTLTFTGAPSARSGVLVGGSDLLAQVNLVLAGPVVNTAIAAGNPHVTPQVLNLAATDLIAELAWTSNGSTTPTTPAGFTLMVGGTSLGSNSIPAFYRLPPSTPGVAPYTPPGLSYSIGNSWSNIYTAALVEGDLPLGGRMEGRIG